MKKLNFVIAFITLLIIAVSCNDQSLPINNNVNILVNKKFVLLSDIPFTEEKILEEIASNEENVPYNIARKLALIEMEYGIKESMEWNATTLSERPVVVFDGKSNPKYYEFIVINEADEAVGTVTAFAKKEVDASVAYVLPYVQDYSSLINIGSEYKLISAGYPSKILLGIPDSPGNRPTNVVYPATEEHNEYLPMDEEIPVGDDAQGLIEAIDKLSEEEREQLEIYDVESIISNIEEKRNLNNEGAQEYWRVVELLELEPLSDEEIITAINESKASWTSYDEYVIPAYNTTNMKRTRWSGWCGPSAVAWIYRGLYSSYGGAYLPLAGESGFSYSPYRIINSGYGYYNFSSSGDTDRDGRQNDLDKDWIEPQSAKADGGLYAKIANNGGLYAWPWLTGNQNGPTLSFMLGHALSSVTNGKYSVSTLWGALTTNTQIYIRSAKLPLLCWGNGFSHYTVIFGSKYELWNWDVSIKVFGKKITISTGKIKTNQWVLMTDNGYTTRNYGYQPYWKNDKIRFNIDYPIYRVY